MKNILYQESIVQIKHLFRIMRIAILSLFLFAGGIFATEVNSQVMKVSISAKNVSARNIISEIEKQTDYLFVFNVDEVNLNRKVNVDANNRTVAEVLNRVFDGTGVYYAMEGKNIMLMSKADKAIASAQQDKRVTGLIKDSNGDAIIGANITVKNAKSGTITDLDGKFSLEASPNAVLVVSYIGYSTQEISLNGRQNIIVVLKEDTKTLEEVVVVGYGVQKKSVVTAAMSQVSADELGKGTPTNVQDVLKGKVAGVQITSQSGQPGMDSKIRIRGTGTVNDSEPLYIVDGMPSSNGINYLNPSDIESIEVLKDAASAAIYGARGANGVVLVTTKKGTAMQKTTLNYEFTYGVQNPAKKLDLMNSQEYQMIMNEMAANSGKPDYFPTESSVDTDWQKELTYSNAPVITHKLSLAGGSEHSTHYASFGYIKQRGILAKGHSDYERYNGRFNYSNTLVDAKDRKFLNKMIFGSIVSYSRSERIGNTIDNSESSGIIASMNMLPPTESVYQDNPDKIAQYASLYPNYVTSPDGRVYNIIDLREISNPLADLQVNHNQRNISQIFNGNFNLDVSILPGLKYKTTAGMEWGFNSTKNVTPVYDLNTTTKNSTSYVNDAKSEAYSWQWENLLSYDKTFGEHHLGLLLGTTLSSYSYSDLSGTDYDLLIVDPEKAYIDIATGDRSNERVNGGANDHKLASVFGRVNYNYAEKYLFEAVVRRDGSSNFGASHKYAIFPSVSLGWVLTGEDFMKNRPEWLDFMKLRASWGQNGNESIGAFGYTSMMSMGYNAVVNGKVYTGAKPSGYVNSDLKWETSEQTDLGLDLRLLNSSLTLSADYFNKKTKDMLMDVSLPEYTGYASMKNNVGTVSNKGFEFETSYKLKIGEVGLNVGANAAYVKNEVTNLGSGRTGLDILGGGLGGTVTWMESGKPYGFFYGYVTDGIFQNQNEIDSYVDKNGNKIQPNAVPGDVRYKDLDGNGTISGDDRKMIGDSNPDWTFGFSLNASWRNFDLNAFFQGAQGNQIYKFYRRANITYANWEKSWLGRWHGEGTSNKLPRIDEGDPHNNTTWVSDLFVEDGSYLRMKVLQLGYQLPQNYIRKMSVSKLRLFVQAENLFTVTNYSGLDPEVGTRNGFDGGTYPQARTFTFGANIVF
ncbi:TonB-dependent receptor [uncultured Bacteroides sp.]|uniref:TonB-dependent receptor n=1 Tax=uncultured Bacteroides sp. TaxID=162156 RepID=UPI002AA6EBF0|nr:TonB-dependent receptor [uncultured Bacteroides sp.]